MKKISLVVVSVPIILAGCVYPAAHVELESNRYQVVSHGSVVASKEKYLERIESKAKKLCGDAGFRYETQAETETKSSLSPVGNKMLDVPYNSVSRVIVCGE